MSTPAVSRLRTPDRDVPADQPAWNRQRGSHMPTHRYVPFTPIDLAELSRGRTCPHSSQAYVRSPRGRGAWFSHRSYRSRSLCSSGGPGAGHARKVDAYRAERPGYELGFLVLDESTAYFETLGSFGQDGKGRPHLWFADTAFTDVMVQSGADCFVWLTPYKRLLTTPTETIALPVMTIIDVMMLRQAERHAYDAHRMVSAES